MQPLDAITARAAQSNIEVVSHVDNDPIIGASLAQFASLAIVFVAADSGEEYISIPEAPYGDRLNLDLFDNANELINSVAAAKKTVVVIHGPGPVNIPWANNTSVCAVTSYTQSNIQITFVCLIYLSISHQIFSHVPVDYLGWHAWTRDWQCDYRCIVRRRQPEW